MIDIELKRDFVRNLYKGKKWKKQVDKMPDDQIVAIYLRRRQVPKAKDAKRALENHGQIKLF